LQWHRAGKVRGMSQVLEPWVQSPVPQKKKKKKSSRPVGVYIAPKKQEMKMESLSFKLFCSAN
jgi:hypothetical protein